MPLVGLITKNSFNKGNVSEIFIHKICKIIEKSSESEAALGCTFDLEFGSLSCELCNKAEGARIFGIPSGNVLYVASTMILHYIEEHGYLPLEQFIDSVMNSPTPGTNDYEDAVAEFSKLHKQYQKRQHQHFFEEASQAANKTVSLFLIVYTPKKRNKSNLISCKALLRSLLSKYKCAPVGEG